MQDKRKRQQVGTKQKPSTDDESTDSGPFEFELPDSPSAPMFDGIPIETIATNKDPVYSTPKNFEAYDLTEVLGSWLPLDDIEQSQFNVRFIARDGYTVEAPLDSVLSSSGKLAFRDLSAQRGQWMSFQKGKNMVTPDPYYLVWPGKGYHKDGLPWAYQLTRIEIYSTDETKSKWAPIEPSGNKSKQIRRGHDIFVKYCGRCHSINLIGGRVGPELNVPMNVTEYWSDSHLKKFIQNPAAYRAGSTMPSFSELSSAQIDSVVRYLDWIGTKKNCKNATLCTQKLRQKRGAYE